MYTTYLEYLVMRSWHCSMLVHLSIMDEWRVGRNRIVPSIVQTLETMPLSIPCRYFKMLRRATVRSSWTLNGLLLSLRRRCLRRILTLVLWQPSLTMIGRGFVVDLLPTRWERLMSFGDSWTPSSLERNLPDRPCLHYYQIQEYRRYGH